MKTIFRTAVLAALVIVASCAKDEANSGNQSEEQAKQLESTPLDVNLVTDNVLITGGTKENGIPPSPNGLISLDVSDTSKTAFLNEGFDVSLNSDSNLIGAYLRFKSEDGTVADDYYDINIDSNISGKRTRGKFKSRKKGLTKASKTNENNLDIDFNAQIEPGKFCYEIYGYDGQGNISAPSEICVTVESWGGKAEVIGNWELEKITHDFTNKVTLPGIEDCSDMETYECTNGNLEANNVCTIQEYITLELKTNGDFVFSEKDTEKFLKQDDSIEACDAIYDVDNYGYDSLGKWAYDDTADRLILISYSGEELYDGETESFTNQPGEGEILFSYYGGDIKLQNGSLVIPFETSLIYLKK